MKLQSKSVVLAIAAVVLIAAVPRSGLAQSPTHRDVSPDAPPIMQVHGDKDSIVPLKHATNRHKRSTPELEPGPHRAFGL